MLTLEKINVQDLFGNDSPVELEIGCGKAKFLVACAEANPNINYIGIDRVKRFMNRGIKRAQKRELKNAFFLKMDAVNFLELIEEDSIQVCHIYFPDPWHKRRHHHRRLLTTDFFDCLQTKMVDDGFVEIATDNKDYYDFIVEAAKVSKPTWKNFRQSVNERFWKKEVKTNYELKYELEGRPLYYLELQKGSTHS